MESDLSVIILSLRVGVISTIITSIFAFGFAWILVKKNFRGKFFLDLLISLPIALPPVLVGYFLLWLFGRNNFFGEFLYQIFGINITFTWFAAVLASFLVSLPLVTRSFMIAISGVDKNMEIVSKSLGLSSFQTIRYIILPIARNGIIAGIILGFIRSLSEFGATIVVAGNIPGKTQTIPLGIYTKISSGSDSDIWPLIIVSTIIATITLSIYYYLLSQTD
ncbi:MAG: molybdate ABC transporter permease subunit [Chloroflexi bacterium]|nr:molybdate ABC transporter permease subunit [Chloroflexota bacterium]|tara:strand:- start:3034 stop:3696 length:663 start_codon:yes stop_codon:yes gene_type:complete